MQIKILHLIEGAKQAEGLTVIIDVFRAFCWSVIYMTWELKKFDPLKLLKMHFN